LVMLSAMIVQQEDFAAQIAEAKRRGKLVAVGGPHATSLPKQAEATGADFLVLDDGELTLPMFVEALKRGETRGIFRSEVKPDVTETPIPRFDLLELDAYDNMSVQFSRGCPFQCEFCDIIVLYGRKPRTKDPKQLLAELQALYDLGWRRSIFLVDDNFIGNKRNVRLMLNELKVWMAEHEYPFTLNTEASVDLAQDLEFIDLMVECNFNAVFLGIETPDSSSLELTQKFQNNRDPLSESVKTIMSRGLRVTAGFIIGFDGEKAGAGDRIIDFVEETSISLSMFSMLQALPNTALSIRLAKENRLLDDEGTGNQTKLMNFIPTRPVETIAQEYVRAFWKLYDPQKYLGRVYRQFKIMAEPKNKTKLRKINWTSVRALTIVCWRQGVVRKTRWTFWTYLFDIVKNKPGNWQHYLSICALGEHFLQYRELVQEQIEAQLDEYLQATATHQAQVIEEKEKDQVAA
ncbi:MAG: B12-binding domain-containing radical SAM protein, partial [Thermosynechococcaceae cyanobacterium]